MTNPSAPDQRCQNVPGFMHGIIAIQETYNVTIARTMRAGRFINPRITDDSLSSV